MKQKHFILIGIAVVLALCPVISPSMLPAAIVGALLGVGTVCWALRGVDAEDQRLKAEVKRVEDEIAKARAERDAALAHSEELDKFFNDNGYAELVENRQRIDLESADFDKQIEAKRLEFEQELEQQCAEYERNLAARNAQQEQILQEKTALEMKLQKEIDDLTSRRDGAIEFVQKFDEAQKKYKSLLDKFERTKKNFEAVEYCIGNWMHLEDKPIEVLNAETALADQESLDPIGEIDIKALSIPDLRKEAKHISKRIDSLCEEFSLRYQAKALKSLYTITVIYLKLELRVILAELRYKAQDEAISKVGKLMLRVQQMYEDGNKTIMPTVLAFLGELEKIFIDAVKVEYLWYLRKEQQRREQIELREKMREEREERMRLEEERKRVAEEEAKYAAEQERLRILREEAVAKAAEEMARSGEQSVETKEALAEIDAQILKVETNLGEVAVQREEIAKRQNGKAGTVYVISNLGSFGPDVFKVGMTRRLEPQDRVDELGDASVPFEFDVHSFIFSEDAVGLEARLHERLAGCRVNKINARKEFFKISLDDIEKLVQETDPTASFNRTMAAEEYKASLSGIEIGDAEQGSDSESEGEVNE
jgi:hypothetical protein